MRVTIDSGGATHLALCSCGWRGMTSRSVDVAQRQARAHEEHAHAGERSTRRHRAAAADRPKVSGRPA